MIIQGAFRNSRSEVFLVKGVLKICSKFTGERSCWSVISVMLLCNFIEITLRHGCCPVNLLYIFKIPFAKNTSGWLLLSVLIFRVLWEKKVLLLRLRRVKINVNSTRNHVITVNHQFIPLIEFLIKLGLPPSKKICCIRLNESPSKWWKNSFYFILKALFVLKIFNFFSWLFVHV